MVAFIQLSVGTDVLSIFLLLCLQHFIKLFLNLVECFEKTIKTALLKNKKTKTIIEISVGKTIVKSWVNNSK